MIVSPRRAARSDQRAVKIGELARAPMPDLVARVVT
jgi:hypothetical protein